MESSLSPIATGLYKPNPLQALHYGRNTVQQHLLDCLPSANSKAFIVTGTSLATKTPLIQQIETLLSSSSQPRHAGTFSQIGQHAPIKALDEATDLVLADSTIDTIISVGGGSPIDSAKAISHRSHARTGRYLTHITVPTTLSAAECTFIAGFTGTDGVKTSVVAPGIYPAVILYDSTYALHTPPSLFASTGIRALDHAVELQYHPTATLVPCQALCLTAISDLFTYLPQYKSNPRDENIITRLFLAAFASLGFLGQNLKGGLGLSHTMGYALGSPYGIPHGITSCMTLGHVVKLKAACDPADAAAVARILPVIGQQRSGDDVADANRVGDRILRLVEELGFKTTLTEKGVGRDQMQIILDRATGGLASKGGKSDKETKLVDGLKALVESLY